MVKTPNKMKEGMFFNIVKALYDPPTANITLNGES